MSARFQALLRLFARSFALKKKKKESIAKMFHPATLFTAVHWVKLTVPHSLKLTFLLEK